MADFKTDKSEQKNTPVAPLAPERRIKLRHIVPSLVTVFAICAGLTSLRMSIEGNIPAALYLIMLAVFLDAADGKIARYLDTASPFGAELDTLADFFNFGIAPGLLIYNAFYHASEYQNLGWLSCLVLAICCALRLARFNVGLSVPPKAGQRDYFTGVPAPALASLALMPVFLSLVGWSNLGNHSHIIAVYEIAIALLAVSMIPTFSIKHASVNRNHLPMIAIGSAIVVICLMVYPWHTFIFANLMYLGSLPVSYMRERETRLAEG
ncbi:CDP-diacylglycerol--serine O-phosphatidyltransferase [Litoreibacter ascidiaceicola]|uniref:CDP-diacylglycerol--serine O-phosphatidyltransferase n=1 Tax=Litoreibacter ascidiaceicola TaxID=1486859 RepID=A0A1M5CD25_9RHOB|nr:phosphatidylcholine/phosphatidylserine synthase [Litoreibacter ascidiaceicola]SHF52625.1 CDP-diacylglycerol--serine O-phosphatidyltransferase [Litoreibacter ascidiaceicola]